MRFMLVDISLRPHTPVLLLAPRLGSRAPDYGTGVHRALPPPHLAHRLYHRALQQSYSRKLINERAISKNKST